MRYVIYGAGGIGGAIGARLTIEGFDTTLIARGAHLEAMQRDGLWLVDPEEETRVPVRAVNGPAEIAFRGDEVVLLTTKTQDTEDALDALRAVAGPEVPVVCVQNGVENERLALRRFDNVYGTLVQVPTTHLRPGEVWMHSWPILAVLDTGRYPGGMDSTAVRLCADLEASGFIAKPDPRIMRHKYAKLLQNLTNVVQAICGWDAPIDEIAALVRAEARHVFAVAGIDCATPEEAAERQQLLTIRPVRGQGRGGGSTWQSAVTGRPLETDYINGEVALIGASVGVPTPANRALQMLSLRITRERLQPGWMTPEALLAYLRAAGARS